MTRAQKIAKNERFRMRFERKYRPLIQKAIKAQISSFIGDLSQGLSYAQSRLSTTIVNDKIGAVIAKLHTEAGVAKANQVYRELIREPKVQKGFGFNAEWTTQILDYFRLHLFDKIVLPITETTKRQIQQQIEYMIEKGESIEWLTQQLESSEFTNWRAEMIARTESSRAINYGAKIGAEKTGFKTKKEWVSVHDNRTRHSHIQLDGEVRNQNEEFRAGLQFPGDPNASGAETINCRCHLEYKPVRDASGRLIPTEGVQPTLSRGRSRRLQRIISLLESN